MGFFVRNILFSSSVLFAATFNSFAVTIPVHHAYVNYNGDVRGDIYNHDIHLTWNKDPDASQMGYYSMYAFYFQNKRYILLFFYFFGNAKSFHVVKNMNMIN